MPPSAGFGPDALDLPDAAAAEAAELEQQLRRRRTQRFWILGGVAICLVLIVLAVFLITAREAATEPGSVRVISDPPGAAVYYRGKRVGTTPHRLDSLSLDERHWVRLQSDVCESKAVRLHVKPGEVQTIRVKLQNCDERSPKAGERGGGP
jgi:hypothetical protein